MSGEYTIHNQSLLLLIITFVEHIIWSMAFLYSYLYGYPDTFLHQYKTILYVQVLPLQNL